MTAGEAIHDPSRLAALDAALDARQRPRPPAWTWLAGLGVVAIAASTLLYWALAAGPLGPLALTDAPLLLWIGAVPAAVGVVLALVRPSVAPTRVAAIVLLGGLVVAVAVFGEARAHDAGPAPWLALAGALLAALAAGCRLAAPEDGSRVPGGTTQQKGPARR